MDGGSVARASFYFVWFFVICLTANLLFIMTSVAIMPFDVLAAYKLNSQIAFFLWNRMQFVFELRHKASITFSGDVLPENENAIVLANHYSYSDFYLINALAARKRMLPYCRWFAKSSLKWQLPVFGWSMDWLKDSNSIRKAFQGLKTPIGVGKKVWLVSFLEGTRNSPEKLQQSQKFCKDNGKKVLKNLLAPRTKGCIAAIKELRDSHVTHIYDLTLAYEGPEGFGRAPDLLTINSNEKLSPRYKFHVHTRRWSLKELPQEGEELKAWIEKVWQEKDEILQGLKQDWINWKGLVGWGAQNSGLSGASGVYRQALYPPIPFKSHLKID